MANKNLGKHEPIRTKLVLNQTVIIYKLVQNTVLCYQENKLRMTQNAALDNIVL